MSELISGKEALIALANGEGVECRAYEKNWINANNNHHPLSLFFDDSFQFRLKPRTITLNGIEIPAPFEPKDGELYWHVFPACAIGYKSKLYQTTHVSNQMGAWRTEEENKQVVAALREVLK